MKFMLLLGGGIFLFFSCTKDPETSVVEEGVPTQMRLFFSTGEMQTRDLRLSDTEEKNINSVQILIFDRNGKLVTNKYYSAYDKSVGILGIPTVSGTGMSVYAIANITAANVNYSRIFDGVKTINDLQTLKVYNIGADVETNRTLLMWGVQSGVTIPALPSQTGFTIPMNYVASRVQIDMIDDTPANEDLSWSDWQMQNIARFSYLLPQSSDAVNPANSSDYVALSSSFAWKDTVFVVNGVQKPGKSTYFYLFENRRGGRKVGSPTDTDPRNKTLYAPDKASAFIANGYYKTASSTKGIKVNLCLGNNSYNDYNLQRGVKYTYRVTVKGINEIDIDSRIDGSNVGFQADLLNTTLDCHYDWRPLRVGSFAGTMKIEVLDAAGLLPVSWLKVSAINLNQFVYSGGNYIRPTYNPATDMVSTISGITFTSTTQIEFKTFYLYADEYAVSGGSRSAQVKITSSQPGATPIVIPITQKGYQLMGTAVGLRKSDLLGGILPLTDYRFAVENQEEATLNLTPGSASLERTSTMQWGFRSREVQNTTTSVIFDYYNRNGYENTQNLVLSNISAGTLLPPYGRTGENTISEQVHNPVFNTYAARYCFEKNRDTNGDGKITGSEIKWYLPSQEELMLVYITEPSLSQITGEQISANPYQTSTEATQSESNLVLQFGIGKTGIGDKGTPLYVRCVRVL